MIADREILRFF